MQSRFDHAEPHIPVQVCFSLFRKRDLPARPIDNNDLGVFFAFLQPADSNKSDFVPGPPFAVSWYSLLLQRVNAFRFS
jgi:hypothetical protein